MRISPSGRTLVQHHAHLVGLLAGLVDEPGLAEFDQYGFSASGDQRVGTADQQLPAVSAGAGDVGDFGDAGLEVFEGLVSSIRWVGYENQSGLR